MRWVKRPDNFSIEHYSLLNEESAVLELKFNHQTNTARVDSGGHKRAYMIEEAGLFRNGIVFRNEYGIEIGYLHFENAGTGGYVQMEDEKYNFTISNTASPKIVFYHAGSAVPVSTCGLPPNEVLSFLINEGLKKNPMQSALLLVMGWYLYSPVLKNTLIA
jgi:hypothetical protein